MKEFRIKFINHKDKLLSQVIELGDRNSGTLGHFPKGAFIQMAKKYWILVAFKESEVLGYLMFRAVRKNNTLSITHLCIKEEYRSIGVAKELMNRLRDEYLDKFSALTLNCREDYTDANEFWKRYGFRSMETKRSRSKAENYLNSWRYELNGINLFAHQPLDSEVVNALLDLNIIIDLRDGNNDKYHLETLLSDWLRGDVEYFCASETFLELLRDTDISRRKQTQQFIKSFKEARVLDQNNYQTLINEISIIIPENTPNDQSDRRQLAHAIENKLDYFITRDTKMIDKADEIYSCFQIEVLSPIDFILSIDNLIHSGKYHPARLAGANYEVGRIKKNEVETIIDEFLQKDRDERKSDFRDTVNRVITNTNNSNVFVISDETLRRHGLLGYTKIDNIVTVDFIRVIKSSLSITLFKQLVSNVILFSTVNSISRIIVKEQFITEGESIVLKEFKFHQCGNEWVKLSLIGTKHESQLTSLLKEFSDYPFTNQLIEFSKSELNMNRRLELERTLFPLKVINPELSTFIIPIKPFWASQLFDHVSASQLIFGSNPSISWNRENIYYRSARPEIVHSPARILWYQSDDKLSSRRKSIIACSYLDDVDLDEAKKSFNKYKKFGTYSWSEIYELAGKDIHKLIMAIRFSDTELFKSPITLEKVRRLLFEISGKKYTFQSPVKINEELFLEIYRLGFNMTA
jgi:ribosomal protein S18 acetylase RimI-like enzyme/predicted nucleic acid-binding protein